MSFEEMKEMRRVYEELEAKMLREFGTPWTFDKIQEELYYIRNGRYPV